MAGYDFSMILSRLVGSTPMLLVMVAGLFLCLTVGTRPQRVRVLVGIAITIQLFNWLVVPFAMNLVLSLMHSGMMVGGMPWQYMLMSLFSASLSGIALGLLLWAAFTRDDRPAG
jgi:hypothetical protein